MQDVQYSGREGRSCPKAANSSAKGRHTSGSGSESAAIGRDMAAVDLKILQLTCEGARISRGSETRQRAGKPAAARRSLPGCVNQTGLTMCMLAMRFGALPHNRAGGRSRRARCGAGVAVVVRKVLLQVKPELVNARASQAAEARPCAWRVSGR